MAETQPVIVDIIRTPMARGRASGALAGLHPADLLSQLMVALLGRTGVDPALVDDIIIGCVSQAGEQAVPVGRSAWLAAGLPRHVPCTMVERRCGSSQQAVHFAAQGIAAGAYQIAIAGGIESMSRVPMGSALQGAEPYGDAFGRQFPEGMVGQGVAAELVAARFDISRSEMDAYAADSHRRAYETAARSGFESEIAAIVTRGGTVTTDETIRAGTTVEALAELQPAFANDAVGARFPEIEWGVTAGNSSQISDGASLALLMSDAMARRLGLKPRARIVAMDVIGDDPLLMLTAPIPATRRVLAKAGLQLQDIDQFEVNEAFASVPLAWQREFGVAAEALNPRGGAIALGHPLGASGTRLMCSLVNGLEQSGGRFGLQTMCEAGGQANATIIERI